jgi:hypothetical protein
MVVFCFVSGAESGLLFVDNMDGIDICVLFVEGKQYHDDYFLYLVYIISSVYDIGVLIMAFIVLTVLDYTEFLGAVKCRSVSCCNLRLFRLNEYISSRRRRLLFYRWTPRVY